MAIVLQSYLLAEWRVTPVCKSDKKTVNVQAGRVFTKHKIFGIFKNITLWKATKDINKNIKINKYSNIERNKFENEI